MHGKRVDKRNMPEEPSPKRARSMDTDENSNVKMEVEVVTIAPSPQAPPSASMAPSAPMTTGSGYCCVAYRYEMY